MTRVDDAGGWVRGGRPSLAGTGAEVAVGDASAPDLPAASFDVVASSLVLFFLPDPRAALARWVALLRPGGRIGVTTFGAQSGLWRELDGLLRPWMPPLDPRSAGPDGPFASDAAMESALATAGALRVTTETWRMSLTFEGVADWLRFTRSVGQRAAWDAMTHDEAERVTDAAARMITEGADGSGGTIVWQDVRCTLGGR